MLSSPPQAVWPRGSVGDEDMVLGIDTIDV